MHLSILEFTIVFLTIEPKIQVRKPTMLFINLPSHNTISLHFALEKITLIESASLLLTHVVFSLTMLLIVLPISFVPLFAIFINVFSFPVNSVVIPVPFIKTSIGKGEFSLTVLLVGHKVSLIDCGIWVVLFTKTVLGVILEVSFVSYSSANVVENTFSVRKIVRKLSNVK